MGFVFRFFSLIFFLLIEFDSLAAANGFNPLKDKTLLTLFGLFVIVWLILGFYGEISGSTRSSEDKGWSLFVLFVLVVVVLILAYECS